MTRVHALFIHEQFVKVCEIDEEDRIVATVARVYLTTDGSWQMYSGGEYLETASARKAGAFIVGYAVGVAAIGITANDLQPVIDGMESASKDRIAEERAIDRMGESYGSEVYG